MTPTGGWSPPISVPARATTPVTALRCDRLDLAGGHGICLTARAASSRPTRRSCSTQRPDTAHAAPVPGVPEPHAGLARRPARPRSTIFVGGDSYAPGQFSTRTSIVDVASGEVARADLERLHGRRTTARMIQGRLQLLGRDVHARWRALLRDARHRRAALPHRGRRGDQRAPSSVTTSSARRSRPTARGSPSRRASASRSSGASTSSTSRRARRPRCRSTRSVDDQIAWLDNRRLAYGVGEEVMEVPADGSAAPRLMLASATNPNRVQ